MNYYIDFDSTLYETSKLTDRMLQALSLEIHKHTNLDKNELFLECKSMFNREHIYDIFKLANYFAEKYQFSPENAKISITNSILNASDLVYSDTIEFLKNLKSAGHKLFILTYCSDSLEYQSLKIAGSKIADYFNAVIETLEPKFELDIDYSNGIFIDDNPKDLIGLYEKNPIEVIRLRRPENKYSVKDIDPKYNIKEYTSLKDIPIR